MKFSSSTYRNFLIAALVLLFCVSSLSAQEADQDSLITTESIVEAEAPIDTGHSVKEALLYSFIPGGGQIYNGKYWKLPIVYGAMGTTLYFTVFNHQEYRKYLDAFYTRIDADSTNDQLLIYTEANLINLQDQYRRWRDLSIILTVAAYGLQMLDAYVDAHLHYFDIDENLSLRWEPAVIRQSYAGATPALGFGITLHFK